MRNTVCRFIKRIHQDEGGKLSVEMILLLALIAIPLILLMLVFRDKIKGWFTTQSGNLDQYNN